MIVCPVAVALNFTPLFMPTLLMTIPTIKVNEPAIFKIVEVPEFPCPKLNVGVFVAPVQSIFKQEQVNAASSVTVWPVPLKELASKKTLSEDVGKEAPGAPPLEADQ